MKKIILTPKAGICISILAVIIVIFACKKTPSANDLAPRIAPSMDVIHLVNEQLKATRDPKEMKKILDENPWVAPRIVTYARRLDIISNEARIDSVVFRYGSAEAQVQDSSAKYFKRKVVDQLVAFIFYDGKAEPKGVIVYCANGVIADLEEFDRIGTQAIEFTIEQGKGINAYVDYQTTVNTAEYFGISLYRGKEMTEKNKISYAEARRLENELDQTQVTTRVYPGDYFNLGTMEYRPAR